jgi:hypothetical protein
MELTQKDFKKCLAAATLVGRIKELDRIEPYISSDVALRRRANLKKELKELVTGKEEKEEQKTVHISVEIPEGKKEKSFKLNLGDIFRGKYKDDNDEPVVRVIKGLWPEEDFKVCGKVISEL